MSALRTMSYEYDYIEGDCVRVIRGRFRGEVGIVICRMTHHPDYLLIRFEDETDDDQPHPLLDRELEMFE